MPINLCTEYNLTTTAAPDANGNNENSINVTLANNKEDGEKRMLCNDNAKCEYTGPGQYKCICNDGFIGDGRDCQRKRWF